MANTAPLLFTLVEHISDIGEAAWDRLNVECGANPFTSYGFLSALEDSGCVGGRTGWLPRHVLLQEDRATPSTVGVVPAYLKLHSQGEYVFDHGWADAFERAGGRYYPKFQACVPFTPVPGPRLLAATEGARSSLSAGIAEVASQNKLSSAHATFCLEGEAAAMEQDGYLIRHNQQFHWHNQSYSSYDQFLEALASRKRKALKKERREALAAGITIEWVTGNDLTEAHFDAFFEFYMDTGSRKWGKPYLNRTFFSLIHERMADKILLVMAKREGRYIAGAINLIGPDALFGRNWGCIEDHPFLHFEVCYHQAIDFAIAHKLARVEAGAQGEHKLARGYLPETTYSAHFIPDPNFRRAVAQFLAQERELVATEQAALTDHGPYKRNNLEQD